MTPYDHKYSIWKAWNLSKFGTLRSFEKKYFDKELNRSKRQFASGARVLEIGFGSGNFLSYATRLGWSVTGIEANSQLVNVALEHRFDVFHADNLSRFDAGQFDLVVAFDVLEHLPKEELRQLFFDINRILKTDGCFVARFPNGDSPFGLLNQNGDMTHVTSIGGVMARSFASSAGMPIIYIGGEAQPLVGQTLIHTLHRFITAPIKWLIDIIVRFLFFPKTKVDFCSFNYTLICKKTTI